VLAQAHDLDHMVEQLARAQHSHHRAQRFELGAEFLERFDRRPRQAWHPGRIGQQREQIGITFAREGA